jgi:hypothetical protein
MPSIPGLSVSSLSGYTPPAQGTATNGSQPPQNTQDQSATAQNSVVATLTSNDQNSATSALTYNASGQLSRFQQAVPQSTSSDTEQAARDAVLNAQNAITQTQGSLNAESSKGSTALDTVAQFGAQPKASESGQNAQAALAQAQYLKNQELSSLTNSNSVAVA